MRFFSNGIIKLINTSSPGVSSWQLVLVRSVFQLVAVAPVIYCNQSSCIRLDSCWVTRAKVLAQAVLGGAMLLCVFEAIDRLPIGDFSAVAFSSPVFTMALSSLLLRERCGVYRALVAALLVAGVLLLTHPPLLFGAPAAAVTAPDSAAARDRGLDLAGICFAVATALLSASVSVLAR